MTERKDIISQMRLIEYQVQEQEKANLYLFMKHCLPNTYRQWKGLPEEEQVQSSEKQEFIEVFDVLIRTNKRLVVLSGDTDILTQ